MATRGCLLITNGDIKYPNAKRSETLLKRIMESDDHQVIFNMWDSGDLLFNYLKDIVETKSFKYYWQYGDVNSISTNLLVQLINEYNRKPNKYDNIGLNHYRVHFSDDYYVDSEYMYWFDWHNKELKQYKCHWTFEPDWDIKSLELMDTVKLDIENIPLYNFDKTGYNFNSYYYAEI